VACVHENAASGRSWAPDGLHVTAHPQKGAVVMATELVLSYVAHTGRTTSVGLFTHGAVREVLRDLFDEEDL
jgi:hypothetical protein